MILIITISFFLVLYFILRNVGSTKIISVDGNIGSGKSTLIDFLKKKFKNNSKIIFLDEPVDDWVRVKDNENSNILKKFYEDKKRWSYTFQSFAFITRYEKLINFLNKYKYDKIIITERSTETDKNVFAKMLYDSNQITQLEYNIYLYWYNKLINNNMIKNIIYVNTNPKTCLERIKKRNRKEEINMSGEYIINVDKYHKDWLKNNTYNICEIEGANDFDNKLVQQNIVNKINKFFNI